MPETLHILHVDDDVADRELVARALAREDFDYRLVQLNGVNELKPLLDAGPYDLVLTDYELGQGDGIEVLNLVRAHWPDVPVIMVTGSGSEEIAISALRHGANDYLLKSPDYIDHLPLRIREVMKATEARRRLQESEARFIAFMDHSPVVAFMKDADGVYVYVNKVWPEMVGTKEDPLGKTDSELYEKEVEQAVRDNDRRVVEQGSPIQTVEHVPGKDGALREWLVAKFPVPTQRGNLLGGIALDLSEQRELERAVESAREIKERVLDSLPANVVLVNAQGEIVETNHAWREYARKNRYMGEHLGLGDNYLDVCRKAGDDDSYASRVAEGLSSVLRGKRKGFSMDYPCAEEDRPDAWYRVVIGPGESGGRGGAVVFHLDVTDRYRAESELDFIANNDPLTGLPNRNFIKQRTDESIVRAQRGDNQLAMLYLDIDGFRTVNDSLGQEAGDFLLKEVARRIRGLVREGDVVARLGGDEYALLLDNVASPEDAGIVAGKLCESIRAPIDCEGHEISVTCTLGIACFPGDGDTAEVLMARADSALNEAKSTGYNNYRFFSGKLNRAAMDNLVIQNNLRLAIERNQLRLVWQPIVDLADGRIISAETLLRWSHPELGMVSPGRFIPVAERIGVIGQLGDWVLDHALARAAQWRADGLLDAPIAINLSMQQFRNPGLADRITELLDQHGLEGEHLVLELTESMLGANPKQAADTLAELKSRGIRTAIDDFGTGYSSLNYLKTFPLDTLKIDRSFVTNVVEDRNDQAISRAIISLAHNLGLRTVAEGIEQSEQAKFMKEAGCDAAQGFWFSMPLSEEDFTWLLQQDTVLPIVLARRNSS